MDCRRLEETYTEEKERRYNATKKERDDGACCAGGKISDEKRVLCLGCYAVIYCLT